MLGHADLGADKSTWHSGAARSCRAFPAWCQICVRITAERVADEPCKGTSRQFVQGTHLQKPMEYYLRKPPICCKVATCMERLSGSLGPNVLRYFAGSNNLCMFLPFPLPSLCSPIRGPERPQGLDRTHGTCHQQAVKAGAALAAVAQSRIE